MTRASGREMKWKERPFFSLPPQSDEQRLWRLASSFASPPSPPLSSRAVLARASGGKEAGASAESEDKQERLIAKERESWFESLSRVVSGDDERGGAPQTLFFFQPRPLLLFSLSQTPRSSNSPSRSRAPLCPSSNKKHPRSASTARPRTRPGPLSLTACSSACRARERTALWESTSLSYGRRRSTRGAPSS